ncbi:MaoC family dehydratase [Microbacterium profundi]|uniref:MaoC family dehydratase n=1 Tax=Microbacterium profundi TaxID=450380 RepID=UPI0027DF733B|nr:MaoC family dehydratase [Microbacterium profundi]MCE7482027.1 MaoC family dehydratase [Microbacterium profundi]
MTVGERVDPAGWQGRFFEDFEPGDVYYHPLGKTIIDADNQWFTLLTQNTAKIHFDEVASAATEYGRPLVNSTFVLALVTGQSVIDLTFNVFANLGWDEVRMPAPVFVGDTISSRSKVLETRPSSSRPGTGIVVVATEGYNQHGTVVIRYRRTFIVYLRAHAPVNPTPRPSEDSLPQASG